MIGQFAFFCSQGGFFCETVFSTFVLIPLVPIFLLFAMLFLYRGGYERQFNISTALLVGYGVIFLADSIDVTSIYLNLIALPMIVITLFQARSEKNSRLIDILVTTWSLIALFTILELIVYGFDLV